MSTALDAPLDAPDQDEQNFVAHIREHGWFRTRVFGDEEGPGFSYTTGFSVHLNRPELMTFGMKNEIAHDLFWGLFRYAEQGNILPIGSRTGDAFSNLPAYAFHVSKKYYPDFLGWSRWFYGGDDFACLQIVWPDRAGKFPWEVGFDPKFQGLQKDMTELGWANEIID